MILEGRRKKLTDTPCASFSVANVGIPQKAGGSGSNRQYIKGQISLLACLQRQEFPLVVSGQEGQDGIGISLPDLKKHREHPPLSSTPTSTDSAGDS